jgi:mannose-6-phosphate isomerase-like protein (cupin superfamily)
MVLAGRTVVAMDDGTEGKLGAGDLFYVPPGHDSWVVGDEPYESLHLLEATEYAKASAAGGTQETPSAE